MQRNGCLLNFKIELRAENKRDKLSKFRIYTETFPLNGEENKTLLQKVTMVAWPNFSLIEFFSSIYQVSCVYSDPTHGISFNVMLHGTIRDDDI